MGNSAADKRSFLCDYARTFESSRQNYIKEGEQENKGTRLETYLSLGKSGWSPGLPWCAAFVSAICADIDNKLGGSPTSYRSTSSQYGGAGIYSTNFQDAQPGLGIIWRNNSGGSGHVGIIIQVNKKGVVTVEGNTGSDNSSGQRREGVETKIKFYDWNKLQNPAESRYFRAYVKLWKEEDISIGEKLPQNTNSNQLTDDSGFASNNSSSSSQQVQRDYSSLFINLKDNDAIQETRNEKQLEEGITTKNDKTKSSNSIPIDTQKV